MIRIESNAKKRDSRFPRILLAAACLWPLTTASSAEEDHPAPPATRTVDVVDDYHGVKVADPYRWLEDSDNPEVTRWLNAQNDYTRQFLDQIPERARLEAQLQKLYAAPSVSAPRVVKDRYFFSRREGNQNHAVLYVRKGSHRAEAEVLIDPNTFSPDGTIAMDWTSVSPGGHLIAYGKSSGGDEKSTLYIKNIDTGAMLTEEIPGTRYCAIAWLPDEKSFYYTRYPQAGTVPEGEENYNRKVYYHRLGDDWKKDPLIVGDLVSKEEMLNPYTNSTHQWLLLSRSVDWAKNDLYMRPLRGGDFRPVAVGLDAQVSADIVYGKMFIHTDHQAPRYRIMVADPKQPAPDHWKELIGQQKGVITGFHVIDRKIMVTLRENAHSRLLLYDLNGKQIDEVKLPTIGSVGAVSGEWDDTEVFFSFQSFAHPPTIYRYDLRDRKLEEIERTDIGIDTARYETTQRWYRSKDGTRVPMFIVHRKGLKLDGRNPTVLYGYGGFDISLTPRFRRSVFPWLDRGGVYAVANLRGGGEFGSDWHNAGRLDKKQNVFDDFIAAAEALIKWNYTNRETLAIMGGSNGGLLVGACAVQRPDLFRAVICAVPLLDMIRYHKFKIARLWIPEYGCADDPEQFKWLYAYSPYHNVQPNVAYPAMLIVTGDSDSRVHPLHAWKMTARLQAANDGPHPILMRMESKAGHGAGKPLSKVIEEQADEWAFLIHELGAGQPSN